MSSFPFVLSYLVFMDGGPVVLIISGVHDATIITLEFNGRAKGSPPVHPADMEAREFCTQSWSTGTPTHTKIDRPCSV